MLLGSEAGDALLLDCGGGDLRVWSLRLRGLWWLSVLEGSAVEVGLEDGRDWARRGREDRALVDGRDLAGEYTWALEDGAEVDLAGEGGAGIGRGGRVDRIILQMHTPNRNAAGFIPMHRHDVIQAETFIALRIHVDTLRKLACEGVVLVHLTAYLGIILDTTHWSGRRRTGHAEPDLLAQHEEIVNVVDLALGVDEQVLQSAGSGRSWLTACLDGGGAKEDSGSDVGRFAESDDLDGVDFAARPLALVGVAAIDDGEVVCGRVW